MQKQSLFRLFAKGESRNPIGYRTLIAVGYRSQKTNRRRLPPKRQAAYTKQDQFWARLEQNEEWKSTILSCDKEGSSDLKSEELSHLLKKFGHGFPTENEVEWILYVTNHDSIASKSGKIKFAIDLWHAYENVRKDLEASFVKFDVDKSGDIDKTELRNLLTHLNEGHAPTVILCSVS